MPTNYPAALDTTTNLPETIADATAQAVVHKDYHNTGAGALRALEAKVGAGVSTPTNGMVLTGGVTPGTSAWAAPGVAAGTVVNIMATNQVQGDGATEDQNAINAQIITPGHYYFPGNRTYLIGDSIWIRTSNVTLEFGPGAILKLKDVGNQPIMAIGNEAFSTINNVKIIGGDFDGNAANQTWRIPHTGVGLPALTGHALFYSGVIGIACWDVYGLSLWGTSVRNTLQHNYTFSHCGDVEIIGCKADATGMSRQMKDATGAADPEGNNSFNVYGAPTTGLGKGVRIVGCTVTNCADVGFELHGNGSGEHTITGCSVIGSCPNGTGFNISAHTGYEFEMESADTANGGFGIISGNVADGLNIAYSALNTANVNYEVKSMVIGPNHAANCTTGLDIAGRHISVTGLVCENMGQDGIKNSIQAWITKTSIGTGNTSTLVNFAGGTFTAAQQALLIGYYATITSGTGSGLASYRQITACTATSITVTPGYAITPASDSVLKFTNHGDWTISNCVFHVTGQGNQYGGIVLLAGAGVVFDGIAVNNCVFHGVGSTGTSFLYSGIYSAGNVLNMEVNGCIAHGFKNGLQCNQPQAVHINGGTYHHNNETGITIANAAGVVNTGSIIQNAHCVDNGVNPTSGTDAGIYLDNAVDTLLEGNVCENSYTAGFQSFGVKLSALPTGVTIRNGDLRGNASAALTGTLNTTTLKEVSGVIGVNDVPVAGATGAAGASVYSVPKSYRPSNLGIFGGTVTLVQIDSVTVATASGVVIPVPAGRQATITWNTTAPTLSQVLL